MPLPARLLRCCAALLLLAACEEDGQQAAKPAPQELTREAIGHYCSMIVADHQGPKAQIFLKDADQPIWFSSVRDAIAFTLLPDEPKNIAAIYVNDMSSATWAAPEPGNWIDAQGAHYVIESDRRGGMGALEAVPFAGMEAAAAFVKAHGGRIASLAEVPHDYILSADPERMQHGTAASDEMGDMSHGEKASHSHSE